ncbi:hypothetical protein COY43_01390 [Candidatus Berkelbacteria bacterium CG_4_10_14_0_8_um_filter_35_9_33_8]|uniref:Type II secretion system protein GspG C-terminal domain-containing protein n=1 Tax=Candidatus Berkelbacteria bacterium CG_4_10_14_0_2_um_filter_35_9_33_12 TaxID=1974499 RepID=A0A2M7W4X8_9BACT|nr:MAG: hypothetical protein COX10_01180 [Candidatus Berkelbacteria bacterium CG23_combo_of_CG06-09_8_20_14_all_33_15]PIS08188.1 MAG: hypothetical protein COT76_02730 [Candidatus Berkelbacteria bacterium CG10_big_fil_rev_8_21_14_0_10_33_10]PIZ28265.1 MAG: hypothetical protein COY43_01390 [Candidatus Berkelbacteria bacterium CG_4_10_14_0_8_um_filter_35_9_33_8]PJA21011.1 MAG: hypothetical protein COX60_00135 [Candidatus Berkelbacteria bacterium CG_4_10_14_0_2_um_filter_35_9_33_12]PJB52134.1 MAG: 
MNNNNFRLSNLFVSVITITLIFVLAIIYLSQTKAHKRDDTRITNIHLIESTLKLYNDKNNRYPDTSDNDCFGFDLGLMNFDPGEEKSFLKNLNAENLITNIPVDPYPKLQNIGKCNNFNQSKNYYSFAYQKFEPGKYGCDSDQGAFYVLGITNFETYDITPEKSPGFSCPELDFSKEFSWVTGKFEK